ncbi:MAG: hypothetical protein K5678_06130 [Acetatifactor sp.]|nr:hypothetical protein [Acetatifactor sp.]
MKSEDKKLLLVGGALLFGALLLSARKKSVNEEKNEDPDDEKIEVAEPEAVIDDMADLKSLEIKNMVFDTAKCSAYVQFRAKQIESIVLASNFNYTHDSKIKWYDEASYGMCTHFFEKEEGLELIEVLKTVAIENWVATYPERRITPKLRDEILELIRQYAGME